MIQETGCWEWVGPAVVGVLVVLLMCGLWVLWNTVAIMVALRKDGEGEET